MRRICLGTPLTPKDIEANAARHAEQEKLIAQLLADPISARAALDAADAEDSLLEFIKQYWHILEPGTPFVSGWPIEGLCDHLEAVTRGEILRFMANVPPGFMKSLTFNVFWPAWEWGPKKKPWYRYVTSSYSEDLTFRDNRKLAMLCQSEKYQQAWGHVFKFEKTGEALLTNDRTGFSRATSVAGVGTGERGDRFKIDDPHNVKDIPSDAKRESALQWVSESVPTRINDPKTSAILCAMQRVHERDVAALLKELGFTCYTIPMEYEPDTKCRTFLDNGNFFWEDPRTIEGDMAFPERYPADYVNGLLKPAMSKMGGDYAVSAQLQQRPTPRGGALFKREWFKGKTVKEIPAADPVLRRIRAWDLAGSTRKRSARTSTTRMAQGRSGKVYVEHNFAFRGSPGDVESKVRAMAVADRDALLKPHVKHVIPQDPGQAGKAQNKQYSIGPLAGFDFKFEREGAMGDKEARANPFASQCEYGNVYLVEGEWIDEWLGEICSFPVGRYRDRVDSTSLAYLNLVERERESPPAPGKLFMPEPDPEQ